MMLPRDWLSQGVLTPSDTLTGYDLARDLMQPVYSQPIAAKDADPVLQLHVPLTAKGQYAGELLIEYSVDRLKLGMNLNVHFASKTMIKWPWKSNELQTDKWQQWQDALDIPLFASLDEPERQRLVKVAGQLLSQKRLVPLQGIELNEQMQARIALVHGWSA